MAVTAKAIKSNVSYALAARTALERVNKFAGILESAEEAAQKCREAWRDYGAALLAQRELTPQLAEFGQWVKENQLDRGRASSTATRADAMWLAKNWITVVRTKPTRTYPTHIRQVCRETGYAWAFDQRTGKKLVNYKGRSQYAVAYKSKTRVKSAKEIREGRAAEKARVKKRNAAVRKREAEAASNPGHPPTDSIIPYGQTVGEAWQMHAANFFGDILAVRAFWKRHYKNWSTFTVPSSLVTLAKQALPEFKSVVEDIINRGETK